MYQRLIRYRTKPDQADVNVKLVEAVYAELHRTQPDGVSYATFRLNDQVTFVHVVQVRQEPSPLLADQGVRIQADVGRVDQPPFRRRLAEVRAPPASSPASPSAHGALGHPRGAPSAL